MKYSEKSLKAKSFSHEPYQREKTHANDEEYYQENEGLNKGSEYIAHQENFSNAYNLYPGFPNNQPNNYYFPACGMIIDDREFFDCEFNSNVFPQCDSDEEEVLLEWDFDEVLYENPERRVKFNGRKNNLKKTSNPYEDDVIVKIGNSFLSEFSQTFGAISITREENRRKFLEEENSGKKESCIEVTSERKEVLVSVNNNENNHKNNHQVLTGVLKRLNKEKRPTENNISPYTEISFYDRNLIDFYLSEYVEIPKTSKKLLTGKKIKDGSCIPPLPSELLDRVKKSHTDFHLKFHYRSIPSKFTPNAYIFGVCCEKLNIDQYYSISDHNGIPSSRLREYISQLILKILYPKMTKWVDLLKVFSFRF
jgi:hypothetical protein